MSTVTMSSAVTTFDPDHYMHPLRQVIHHPTVLLFFKSILKNDAVEETLCAQARNATASKTLITPTSNTTHTNPQSSWGDIMQ